MGNQRRLLTLFCALEMLGALSPADATNQKAHSEVKKRAGYHNVRLTVDGVRRKFKVYVPKRLSSTESAPLVLVLHGALCSGDVVRWSSGMSAESERRGFVVIYPNGLSPGLWNAGGISSVYKWRTTKDVEFLSSVIDYAVSVLKTDPNRTFVAGVSNGGMMAYRLASALPEKIAAIGAVNGAMVCDLDDPPADPISVIAFHGMKDRIIRFDGSQGRWLFWKVQTPPAEDTLKYWIKHDDCNEEPIIENGDGYNKETFSSGKNGTEVCLYRLTSGHHSWPGGRQDKIFHPITARQFSVTRAMCDFFEQHPKGLAHVGEQMSAD